MEARGQTTCSSCADLRDAEARDATTPRDLDVVAASRSLYDPESLSPTSGAPDPLTLHPEGPSLERREALNALAWQLTQLAFAVGVPPEAAFTEPNQDPDPSLSRWQVFVQEMRVEFSKALRREIAPTEQGFTEVFISLPFFLPASID